MKPVLLSIPILVFISYSSATANAVNDLELQILSEAILAADENNVADLITVNPQADATDDTEDNAQLPLLTVKPEAYEKLTIKKLIALHDNYVALVNEAELVTPEETIEEKAFLDSIMKTKVMQMTEKFLVDVGLIKPSSEDVSPLLDAIHQIWFGLYSRSNGTLGSSGFEYVFLGEVRQEEFEGFHNWVFFSTEEGKNRINYKGKIGPTISLGNKGQIIAHKSDWNSRLKNKGSMFVGTSPELELALYTICFYTRPGAKCPLMLNSQIINIETQNMYDTKGNRYVYTAYPVVPYVLYNV